MISIFVGLGFILWLLIILFVVFFIARLLLELLRFLLHLGRRITTTETHHLPIKTPSPLPKMSFLQELRIAYNHTPWLIYIGALSTLCIALHLFHTLILHLDTMPVLPLLTIFTMASCLWYGLLYLVFHVLNLCFNLSKFYPASSQ